MSNKLLLADDEEGIRKVLGISLADRGYDVLTAKDGEDALKIFRRVQPQIVLTDIKMPGMDGLTLARLVRQQFPQTAVVMLTAYVTPELIRQTEALSIRYVLNKPVKLPEIRQVVSEILLENLLTG